MLLSVVKFVFHLRKFPPDLPHPSTKIPRDNCYALYGRHHVNVLGNLSLTRIQSTLTVKNCFMHKVFIELDKNRWRNNVVVH